MATRPICQVRARGATALFFICHEVMHGFSGSSALSSLGSNEGEQLAVVVLEPILAMRSHEKRTLYDV